MQKKTRENPRKRENEKRKKQGKNHKSKKRKGKEEKAIDPWKNQRGRRNFLPKGQHLQ